MSLSLPVQRALQSQLAPALRDLSPKRLTKYFEPFSGLPSHRLEAPSGGGIMGIPVISAGMQAMPKGSDTELQGLIDLAKRGDKEARGRLLDHACERLLKLTRAMFTGFPSLRRWEQTDDVFVNSMLRLHRALESVQPESVQHFFNLAGTQIRRELLDLKKHYYGPEGLGANHHTDIQPSDAARGTVTSTATEPEDLSMWTLFHEKVDGLPTDLRETFNLIYYQGLTQEESADALGISLSTVKRRWQQARIRLHDELGESSRR